MRLKSIMLHGFKSFCNRTEIPLGSGITGIVGPNGCGKSNVSDAIRWVLGEGNVRNLRGENILDVIFKGSGVAKPSGFAEVSLLVDNEDHSLPLDQTEVGIARRVYRSGDSEFLINQIPCRLKDIRNLFLGTGLGSHGYSVIERDMVDAVLSDHDDQRRLFFEEAAGISRYKIQRKEATRKLEATEQDLQRIDDIVREIEREVRSLARQVGKARRHEKLIGQIRDLEVDLALVRWTGLTRRYDALTSDRDQWAGERERLASELAGREAALEGRKLRLLERERALDEARRLREERTQELASSREEASVLATRIQGWDQRDQDLARRIEEESLRETSLRTRIEEMRPEAGRIQRELEQQRGLLEAAETLFGQAEQTLRGAREEAARTAQIRMENLLVQTKDGKELESLESQHEHLGQRRGMLWEHREGLQRKAGELAGSIGQLEGELAGLEERLERIRGEKKEREEQNAAASADREALRTKREDAARNRASIESRLSLLREQKERHEGFDVPVRALLERRGALAGVHGVAGELISTAGWLTEASAEAILADAIQWVIVDDEDAACRALDLLRAEGGGGVTFFPLRENAERLAGAPKHWPGESPLTGPPHLRPLLDFLESRMRPAESRDAARSALRGTHQGPALRHLSPEGEIFSTEGWIRATGGREADRQIIERMREIPRLEEALAQCEREEAEVRGRLAEREAEIAGLTAAIERLDAEAASTAEQDHRLERQLSERRVERGLLLEEEERGADELAGLDERLGQLAAEREEIRRRLGLSDASGREAEERHRRAVAAEEECGRARDRAFEELSGRRTEAVRVENALRELTTAISRDSEEAERLAAAIRQWGEERTEAARLREEASARRAGLVTRAAEIESTLADADRDLDRKRQERDEDQTLLAAQEHELKELRADLGGLQERLHGDQVRVVEIRSEMDRLRERLLQEFRVDLAEEARRRGPAADEAPAAAEEPDEEAARRKIEALRELLQSLGPVNFLAAEEYARQKERLVFHRTQREDLRKAQKDLLETIRQINETAGQMFQTTFEAARERFREVFEGLFPGGEADLRMLGDDPLEAELEIVARPSGKKLEAIRLLSTGERSLTAIALLFGIYLVKPSPFCILDELDAPLDDANIGRFVNLMRTFSERTQFVVITHNKRSMEAADRLYGVTMQQPGVSKIVSVRLTETGAELVPVAPDSELAVTADEGEP